MITFLKIGGGVSLILFGVRYLRKGLDRLLGANLGPWIARLTDSRLKAFFSGLCAAVVSPSSTGMSLLTVRAVQDGHMTTRQGLAMMFGADVGLTITVLLMTLRLDDLAPVLLLAGVLLYQFTSPNRSRGVGQILLSLGFIFLGIVTIKGVTATVAGNKDLGTIISVVERYPFALAILGCLMAMGFQSSTATIGLVIGMGAAGAVKLPLALSVVAGANVGVAVTMLLIGWEHVASRRLAVGNLSAKLAIALGLLIALNPVAGLFQSLPGALDQRVAFAHSGFNALLAILGLPLVGCLDWLTHRWITVPPGNNASEPTPPHIHVGLVDSLSLSLGQSTREILSVAETLRVMLGDMCHAIRSNDAKLAFRLSQRHHQVQMINLEIARLINLLTDQKDICQLRYLIEMETIGRVIDQDLSYLVACKINRKLVLSPQQQTQLDDYFHKVAENLLMVNTAFVSRDRMMAKQLMLRNAQMKKHIWEQRQRAQADLNNHNPHQKTNQIHWKIHFHLWRINVCLSNVALAILEQSNDTHSSSHRPPTESPATPSVTSLATQRTTALAGG